jgi:acetyl-CoA C-acetyltransferase
MSRAQAHRLGVKPLARIVGYTHAAVPAQWLFIAPARAIPKLLDKINWTLDDFDLIEINEAFAAQVLADARGVEQAGQQWDWNKVNVNGGAIALGHPSAAAAPVCWHVDYALHDRGLQRGLTTSLGGGEGGLAILKLTGYEQSNFTFCSARYITNSEEIHHDLQTVGIVGVGQMGSGIVEVFARAE